MKNNKFIKSTMILIISGFLTKIIGFIIRIVYTRIIGEYGIGLLSIATPTYSLLLTIATLSIPISISKLVSENKGRSIKILTSASFLILFINFILILLILCTHKYIAINLLKEPQSSSILICYALTLPFVSISSVIKGYFAGKQNMIPHATSNVIEQIIRLIIIIVILPTLLNKGILYAVCGLILLTIISEICSIIVFMFFLPKKINLKTKLLPDTSITKKILNISIPTVSGRIIGNIGYFFEPIIITNILLYKGFTNTYILNEYGAYNAYAITLLSMPSFFIAAIATSILPEISKYNANNNFKMIKKRIRQSLIFALCIGTFFSLLIYFFRNNLLFTLYKTTNGSDYIKILAPVFVLFYLEGVLASILQGLGYAKKSMQITTTGVLIKLIFLIIFCFQKYGIYSLVYAEIINIFYVVIHNLLFLKKIIKKSTIKVD